MTKGEEPTYFPIRELSTYQVKWTIRARVTSRGPLRTFKNRSGNGEGKVYHVELLDSEGGEIRASFFNEAADKNYEKMEAGKCFVLSKGQVRIANRQYNMCKHRYELIFDKMAQVEQVGDVVAIDAVRLDISDLRSVQSKTLPCSVDICGIIASFEQTYAFTSKDGKDLVKRELTIADDSAVSMKVTIWGDRAKKADAQFEGNPVIAMKGVYVKEWNGGIAGSLLEGGQLITQPMMPEAAKVKAWWAEGGSSQKLKYMSETTGGGGGGRQALGKTVDAEEFRLATTRVTAQPELYTLYCRLSTVQTRKQGEAQPLTYTACAEPKEGNGLPCNRRVDGSGFCSTCNRAGKTSVKMALRCSFIDATDSFWVTTFHEASEKVVNMKSTEVHEVEQQRGREAVENALKDAYYGDLLQITIRAKMDSYNGELRPNATCVSGQPVNLGERGRSMLGEIRDMIALR
eukprot:TRINITY_DN90048_c0_g1_i1.p1 TRINITY_DN90048_c0_g1~~TRINITY_DN90048_c0_g1_i1.p1  ORF type:complete len:459 (+),score=100.34 TRINITY_DN90048_c0_g1_i1:95-1471(+)